MAKLNKSEHCSFWERVVNGPNGCWNWTGCSGKGTVSTNNIYGRFWTRHPNRKGVMAHRYAYEQLVGPIPAWLTVDHLCSNTICVNPGHMEIVTGRENTLRGNNLAARNKRKTHCKDGYLLSDDNVYKSEKTPSRRVCKKCRSAYMAAYRLASKPIIRIS